MLQFSNLPFFGNHFVFACFTVVPPCLNDLHFAFSGPSHRFLLGGGHAESPRGPRTKVNCLISQCVPGVRARNFLGHFLFSWRVFPDQPYDPPDPTWNRVHEKTLRWKSHILLTRVAHSKVKSMFLSFIWLYGHQGPPRKGHSPPNTPMWNWGHKRVFSQIPPPGWNFKFSIRFNPGFNPSKTEAFLTPQSWPFSLQK